MCAKMYCGVYELESIDIAKAELNVSINDKLRKTKDFSTHVESVSKTRLLTLKSEWHVMLEYGTALFNIHHTPEFAACVFPPRETV
jgi:hypothetical protein